MRSGFLELADHAGLGDGEGLLLHGLVYAGAVRLTDRAELVNAAHAAVSQHCSHNSQLNHHLCNPSDVWHGLIDRKSNFDTLSGVQ